MATSWPLIEAMRRCAYVPFYDTDGDVIKCNCCQQEEEELTKKDLQEDWGDAYECVQCKSYICPECWNTGYSDVPGTPDRDHNQSEQRAYISFAFAYMQWHGGDRNWGQWNFCSQSCRARHHWFRAACKINIMAKVYLNSDPFITYKRNIQKSAAVYASLLQKRARVGLHLPKLRHTIEAPFY